MQRLRRNARSGNKGVNPGPFAPIVHHPMPATQEISESLVRENISRAVINVFETMLHCPISLCDPMESWPPPAASAVAEPQIVGAVGFLGDVNGLIYLYFQSSFASNCTGKMLGLDKREVEEGGAGVVNDAIGEITNMIVGNFKNCLCDAGLPCKLTVPSILRGMDLKINATGHAIRHSYLFDAGGHHLVADIIMKGDQ